MFCGSPETADAIRDGLKPDQRIQLLESREPGENLITEIRRLRPAAVVLTLDDASEKSLAQVSRVKESLAGLEVICASHDASPDFILRSLRSGARDFLRLPVNVEELRTVVSRTAEYCLEHLREAPKRGRVAAVFSGKGGCGASFVATNLAATLKAHTVLVDLNLQGGDLDLFLGLQPQYSIADLILNRRRLDDALLQTFLTNYSEQLSLLSSPRQVETAEGITPEQISEVLEILRGRFSYVVLDLQDTLNEVTLAALDQADDVILLMTLDIPAVRNAHRTLGLFGRLRYPPHKIHLVVNRLSKQADFDVTQVERYLSASVAASIHNDYKAVVNSINNGRPLVELQPSSVIAEDFRRLVGIVPGLSAAAPVPEPRKGFFESLFQRSVTREELDLNDALNKV
jgi:pilus assembly protein CpaE